MYALQRIFLTGTTCLICGSSFAQSREPDKESTGWLAVKNDSAYVEEHDKELTMRVYGSRKFTHYDITDRLSGKNIAYRPNSNFNVGIGANYKFLGLNIGLNLPFINHDNDKYGATKYLDLQSHLYLRSITIDFYGQRYKGYYISNPGTVLGDGSHNGYPVRSDLYSLDLGMNVQYIFNGRRFSYRAAYLQNEYQKKSAGSFLAGGEFFILKMKADSSIIPRDIATGFNWKQYPFTQANMASFALNGGYTYTLVLGGHFFMNASLTAGLGMNNMILRGDGSTIRKWGPSLNNTLRVAAGYNSSRYYAGIQYVDMTVRGYIPEPKGRQAFGTGNLRINLVRRFTLKKKLF